MDWGLLNALGITVMAALGLWILEREHKKARMRAGKDGQAEKK